MKTIPLFEVGRTSDADHKKQIDLAQEIYGELEQVYRKKAEQAVSNCTIKITKPSPNENVPYVIFRLDLVHSKDWEKKRDKFREEKSAFQDMVAKEIKAKYKGKRLKTEIQNGEQIVFSALRPLSTK